MKLERLFEKFDLFAEAPDAVARMREVILWSAFSGVLSPGERNQSMPKEWGINDAPVFFSIPSSWEWKRGCDIFDVIRGVTYKKEHASDAQVEGYFPLLRANNIGNGINFDNLVYVPRENVRDEQFIRLGDILIAMSSGSKKLVGKAAPILTNNFVGSFGAFCGIIRNKSSVLDGMLAQYFQSPQYTLWVTEAGRGIGINNLSKGDLNALPVPIPPPNEQNRIVAKVEELMALCDQLEAQQQERQARHAALVQASLARFTQDPTPANLQFLFHPSYTVSPAELRKTILTLAVQGKLVLQDPKDEPAEELINRIASMRRAAKAKEYAPVTDDDIPYKVPYSWSWVRLGNISLTSDSGWSPQCHAESREGKNWGVLKVSAVSWGLFKPEENKALPLGMEARPDCEVRPGDFLLSRANTEELVARSVVVNQTPSRLMMSDKIVRFIFPDDIEKNFINLANTSDSSRAYYALNASGTSSSMKNVGRTVMCNLPIPLPPLAEQRRIVAKVDELLALVDELEIQLAASQAVAQNLLAALVRELTTTP